MNKEQQIEEFQNDIIDNLFNDGTYGLAEALYNAGYRKTFTSDFASDTQKAYKEGYEKGIEETVEKPVDTQKREYENIDDIARGFVVKDGKILYVTNILDGYRHEFKDIHEICDEMNAMMKQLDSLTELSDYLKAMNKEIRDNTAQEILSQLAKMANRETPLKADIEELAEKWGVEVKQ